MRIRKLGLATVLALSIVSYGAKAETTNEQSVSATVKYQDGKWSYGGSATASQTNSHGSNSTANSATVTYDSKQGTSVTGTSSQKTSR
jgi:hypothetical protein